MMKLFYPAIRPRILYLKMAHPGTISGTGSVMNILCRIGPECFIHARQNFIEMGSSYHDRPIPRNERQGDCNTTTKGIPIIKWNGLHRILQDTRPRASGTSLQGPRRPPGDRMRGTGSFYDGYRWNLPNPSR